MENKSLTANTSPQKLNQIEPQKLASNPTELTKYVDSILKDMQSKFENVSKEVVSKMDEMSERIDKLEQSIQEMINDGEHLEAIEEQSTQEPKVSEN